MKHAAQMTANSYNSHPVPKYGSEMGAVPQKIYEAPNLTYELEAAGPRPRN